MKTRIYLLLIFITLLVAALACIGDPAISYADQTATRGAEEFYAQLTAIATEKP